jgi:predicted ribosomally synthesized peptide with SipW-like signal peptide
MSDKEFSLSRRKALAGLGSIGAASALGLGGTYAQFTDTEEETFAFTAGGIDGHIRWGASYNGQDVQSFNDGYEGGELKNVETPDGEGVGAELHFTDIKPGDYGCFSFLVKVENNPAWVASCIDYDGNYDGEVFEPEVEDDDHLDESQIGDTGVESPGEIPENMLVLPFYKPEVTESTLDQWDPCIFFDEEEEEFNYENYEGSGAVGTATDFWDNSDDEGQGLHPLPLGDNTPLNDTTGQAVTTSMTSTVSWGSNGNNIQQHSPPESIAGEGCFFLNGEIGDESANQQEASPLQPGTWYGVGWDWHVPFDTGNEMQGDEMTLKLGFTFGQVRHTESPELSNIYAPGENLPDSGDEPS